MTHALSRSLTFSHVLSRSLTLSHVLSRASSEAGRPPQPPSVIASRMALSGPLPLLLISASSSVPQAPLSMFMGKSNVSPAVVHAVQEILGTFLSGDRNTGGE